MSFSVGPVGEETGAFYAYFPNWAVVVDSSLGNREIFQHPGLQGGMLLFSLRNNRELEFFGVATWGLVGLQALLETKLPSLTFFP